ncbi:MAG: DUF1036 domain-containing protein [Cypionkella sp.]|nr:DUF1036 domain-containing protein [Cypionkella sp.]
MWRGVIFGAILTVCTGAAQAELTLCNKAAAPQTVGLAYKSGDSWFSEGWWTIAPSDCKTLVGGDLAQRNYYYTIKDPSKDSSGFAGEGYRFCAKDDSFELTGADGDCGALGATSRDYALIDTGETAPSFTFDLAAMPRAKGQDAAPALGLPDSAMRESFTRGTIGEPFVITARMQNCTDAEGFSACYAYAEGWMWVFDRTAAHNLAALDAMASLPVNTMLTISGDVIAYNDISVDALVAKIELAPPDANSAVLDAMQGTWVSADDSQSKMTIFGSEVSSSYGDEGGRVSVLSFVDTCEGRAVGEPGKPAILMQEMGLPPEDALCYAIEEASAQSLTLMYLPRGNLLTYTRP